MTKEEQQLALAHIMHDKFYEDCSWCMKKREDIFKEAEKQRKKKSEGFNFNV